MKLTLLLMLISMSLMGQPISFSGGPGDGSSYNFISNSSSFYNGGLYDGYSIALLDENQNLYKGGKHDGFVFATGENILNFYKGGSHDGFTLNSFVNPSSLFTGGPNDGHFTNLYTESSSFYTGGPSDGFSEDIGYFYFIWDGSIGTGWNIAGNWNTNSVPTYERRVRIPAGVPTYPFLNAGTLKVGGTSGSGTFQAQEIIIEPGALMVARINNFIENYGLICVEGVLELRNPDPLAFRNLNGATLLIKSGGELRTNF